MHVKINKAIMPSLQTQHSLNNCLIFKAIYVNNCNIHLLEVASRYRDPQLQVDKKYWYLFTWDETFLNLDV